jgi:hypothetical protein
MPHVAVRSQRIICEYRHSAIATINNLASKINHSVNQITGLSCCLYSLSVSTANKMSRCQLDHLFISIFFQFNAKNNGPAAAAMKHQNDADPFQSTNA